MANIFKVKTLIGKTGIFSQEVSAPNLIYNTGNQTISGIKTFDVFPIVSGNKLITGIDLSSYATTSNLLSTGSILDDKINSLSGYVNSRDSLFSGQIASTGSILDNKINALSGYVNSQDNIFSGQIRTTGSLLNNRINSLSGVSVLTFGNQTISGIKTFATGIIVSGNGISTNSLDLNNIDILSISGLNISVSNSTIVINNSSSAGIRINSSGINLINGDFQLDSRTATNVNSIPLEIAAIQKSAGEANPINITTFSPHGYRAGDTVIVAGLKTAGCNDSALNGTYAVNEVTSITSFRYYIPGNNTTALSNLYAVGCGFPPATVTVSGSKVYLSHLNYSGYNNLLINNPPLILSNKININHSRTIASSASTGLRGDISWDSNYLYVCVQDNTWKRFSGFAW